MNCFEWQSVASDYLDGLLSDPEKHRADAHVQDCPRCGERLERYRALVNGIVALPKHPLPAPLRKAPLGVPLPLSGDETSKAARTDAPAAQSARGRSWRRTPWFVRTSVEGIGIAAIILVVVALVPRITQFYQRSFERRLAPFQMDELARDLDVQQVDTVASDASLIDETIDAEYADEYAEEPPADISGTGEGADEEDAEDIYVGNSEIWRFNVKTDSPREMKPKVVETLTKLAIPPDTPGIEGIEAPGGIQFNLLVPKGVVPDLKKKVQELAHTSAPLDTSDTSRALSSTFTWYRNKSRKRLPSGTARVVIWLSLF